MPIMWCSSRRFEWCHFPRVGVSKMKQRPVRLLRDGGKRRSDTRDAATRRATGADVNALKTPGSSFLSSNSLVVKRKVDELFRRLQPHSLVQSTEKLLSTLRLAPKLFVNGEELLPKAPPAHTVAAAAATGNRRPASTTAAWRFQPGAGRFRYGLSLQYSPRDDELSLSYLEALSVMLSSAAMPTPRELPPLCGSAPKTKDWRLVAETEDPRIGLALYGLPLGDWNASSIVALVWTQKREIASLFLQLHTTEMLYSAPQRTLKVRWDDDLDRTHGLHSYTTAISLRSLDELFWEHEAYQVEFPSPESSASSITVHLLDVILGGTVAARDRMLVSETDPSLTLETEAVKYPMSNCLLVDFTLWDADCVPVWGFSRALELVVSGSQHNGEDSGFDLSVSSVGGSKQRSQLRFEDDTRGNALVVSLTKTSPSTEQQATKKTKTWVSQVDLTLSLHFINATFGTKY